jgi:mono/diheme cytochrome c family protein
VRPANRFRATVLALTALAILTAACAGSIVGSEESNELAPAPPDVDDGQRLYGQFCSACHGPDGEGQPDWKIPDENGLRPAPPHDASGHTWHHPDSLLLDIIANGSMFGPSNMPAFGDALTDEEQRAVLAFIKTWWEEDQLEIQEEMTSRG